MTETMRTPPYTLAGDEKASAIMVYTANSIYWGEVITKQMIRVSTWLRTNSAPDWLCLFNAKAMSSLMTQPVKPHAFTELHIAVSQVLAYHLMPPAKDPLDYDVTEPNRKMHPVTVLIGPTRIDGYIRLASQSSVSKYLEVAHEPFTGLYDAKISNLNMPGLGVISVPFLLVRKETSVYTES